MLLVNGLCSLPDNAVLVLDDYHSCPRLTSNLRCGYDNESVGLIESRPTPGGSSADSFNPPYSLSYSRAA